MALSDEVQGMGYLLDIKDRTINGGMKVQWIGLMTLLSGAVQSLAHSGSPTADDIIFLTENRSYLAATGATVNINYNGCVYVLSSPNVYMMSYAERELFYQQRYDATAGFPDVARATLTDYIANGADQYFFD